MQIPKTLLYEEFGGRKYYRRGYRDVLLGLRNEGEILPNNFLLGLIVSAILFHLKTILSKKKYWCPIYETGQYGNEDETLVNDIAVVEKSKILNPPPLIIITPRPTSSSKSI